MELEDKVSIHNEILKEKLIKSQLENEHYRYINNKTWLQSKLIIQAIVAGFIFSGTYFFLINPILKSYESIANEKSELAGLKSDQARVKALIALERNELQELTNKKTERELIEKNNAAITEIEKLVAKRKILENELDVLNDTIKNHKNTIASVTSKNKVLEDSFNDLKIEFLKNKSLYKSMEKEILGINNSSQLGTENIALFSASLVNQASKTLSIVLKSSDEENKNKIINEYLNVAILLYEEFTKIKLTQPLKLSLKNKRELMQNTINLFGYLSKGDNPNVRLTSIYYIAQTYYIFSKDLLDSDRPSNLNSEEIKQYEILLEDQAIPFEDKSIQFFETVYNDFNNNPNVGDEEIEYLKITKSMLVKLFPVKYSRKTN